MDLSLTESLAHWIHDQRKSGFADDTLATAQYYLIDWLGSALAGRMSKPGRIMLNYAAEQNGGRCHVIGQATTTHAETAALVNGALSHIVEMDDLDRRSVVHPAAVVIPAALAAAERIGASGRQFLSAIVAGYEVAIRIGEAVGKRHYFYFHNTSTCGVFGAAVAAGWLYGLTTEQLVWALGNAGTQSAGLWQFNADGDMSKHLHTGMAAANGMRAAELARGGLTGARRILEGERGFFAATAPGARPDLVTGGLGEGRLKIDTVSIKPHASCRHTHPAIDAVLALLPQIGSRSITSGRIKTYQAAIDLCNNETPDSSYAAKFSLQYCVAAALNSGRAGLAEFDSKRIRNPPVQSMLELFSIELDPGYESLYPDQWAAAVEVTLADGTLLTTEVKHPKGDPENPLSLAELKTKFCELAGFGQVEPGPWLEWIDGLLEVSKLDLHDLANSD